MLEKKRGQSSTIGVTIAIILGVLLVVFLVWGFSTNWSMFSSTSGAYSGKTNIDVVKQACKVHCENNRITEYCEVERNVIDKDGKSSQMKCTNSRLYPDCAYKCSPVAATKSCVPNKESDSVSLNNQAKGICAKYAESGCNGHADEFSDELKAVGITSCVFK